MIKKSCLLVLLIFSVSYAKDKSCDFFPIKPMKPLYYGQILFDRIEHSIENRKNLNYEITGWYGGDYQRLWIEIEGKHSTERYEGEIERFDILYGKLISPFWDFRIGGGYTGSYGESGSNRYMGVIGFKGLAPYFFEIDTNLRLTTKGELLGDFEAEYDLLITQKLVFQPRFDSRFSFSRIREMGIGEGINDAKLSFRIRYELKREFAPYIGAGWATLIGDTKNIAQSEGKKTDYIDIFLGIRMWF